MEIRFSGFRAVDMIIFLHLFNVRIKRNNFTEIFLYYSYRSNVYIHFLNNLQNGLESATNEPKVPKNWSNWTWIFGLLV